ncbi:MAG TPA: efflux RND transporter permease subunit [Gammaproteobacteria bacterium]|nr:efflux RND transporter permease subunit [Gammaproteobacteria bacterium]
MKISSFCIGRPVFTFVINTLIVLAGLMAYRALTIREFPNVSIPVVSVSTYYSGASAEIVESQITHPLEETLSSLEGLDFVTSVSQDEKSEITLTFKPTRNIENATNDIRDKISQVSGFLPEDVNAPIIQKNEADSQPIFWLAFNSDRHDLMEISDFGERIVKNKLEMLPGVAAVFTAGERQRAMRIWVDPYQLSAYNLTTEDIASALKRQNIEVPAGRVESDFVTFTVYAKTDLQTEQAFKNIILKSGPDYAIRLEDVAKVEIGPRTEQFLARFDGKPSLALGIVKQSTANPLDIAKALKKTLPGIQASLPEGMHMEICYDSTESIQRSIKSVYHSIFEAILLVVLVIYVFLRTFKATLIPIVTIPISLIGGFGLILLFGFSINTLTLLAMVLAIGLVVDDAIVVLENIHRHIESGLSPLQAAFKGSREIGPAIIAMTLTLMAVFAPVAFSQGQVGKLFREFAVVLAGTVFISGFTALTLSPMMCARLLKHEKKHGRFYMAIEEFLEKVTQKYKQYLRLALNHKFKVLIGFVVILALNAILFMTLSSEMAPTEDRGFVMTMGMAPEGSSIQYTDKYAKQMEGILASQKEVEHYFVIVGYPYTRQTLSFSTLQPIEKRKLSSSEAAGELSKKLFGITGLMAFAFNPPSSLEGFSLSGQVSFVIELPGDLENLQQITQDILQKVRTNPGLLNVDTDLKLSKPQINLLVDRDKAATLGVEIDSIGTTLQTLFGGNTITHFTEGNKRYDVIVQADPKLRRAPSDIQSIFVRGNKGNMVRLEDVVSLKQTIAPSALNHFNKLPSVTITANLAPGYTLPEALTYLEKTTKEINKEVQIDYSGASRAYREGSHTLYLTFGLALIVVFLVLAAQFESFLGPLVIMFSVPLGILGAILTLHLIGSSLNIYSQIGLITLVGLITKHGILIVEFTNQLQLEGKTLIEAIIEASSLRLRPILMTTFATIFGALPLALASGYGAEGRNAIGWAVVGGMTIGTFLTLFVVPGMILLIKPKHHQTDMSDSPL